MIVDIHAHTFPDKIAGAAVGKLQAASGTQAFADGTMAGLKASMRKAGIGRAVVQPVATNPAKVQAMNDLSARLTGQEGLIYFGCMHPLMENAEAEVERMAALGLQGFKIHPLYQGTDIDDIRFVRILARAGEAGLTVLMHAGEDIGFPGEVRCSPEMTRRALLQAGPVRLICAHMGGWRNWERVADSLADTAAMIDTSFSLGEVTPLEGTVPDGRHSPMLDGEAFCNLVRAFGAERVLFGTDSPWADQQKSVEDILALPLTEEEKALILGRNAQKMLHI